MHEHEQIPQCIKSIIPNPAQVQSEFNLVKFVTCGSQNLFFFFKGVSVAGLCNHLSLNSTFVSSLKKFRFFSEHFSFLQTSNIS